MHKSQTAEAFDDNYTFNFNVTVHNELFNEIPGEPPLWLPGSVTIAFYTNDGGGWAQRATQTFNGSFGEPTKSYTGQTKTVSVNGLSNHSGKEFAIDIMSSSNGGSSSFTSVTYTTGSTPSETTATPDGISPVTAFILGGA